jgi:SAM-dependent methyltransferase
VSYDGLKASFNSAALAYDAVRPSYPPALVGRIIQKSGLTPNSWILEVGAGTGKASVLFASRGFNMLCLEPGVQMGEIARQNLASYRKARVETTTFEEWPLEKGAFDLVISAQAFHWIDPKIGIPKAGQALKPGGWIALFWNLPNDPETGIYEEVQQAYRDNAPEMERRHKTKSLSQEALEIRTDIAKHKDIFPNQFLHKFSWKRQYNTAEYLSLLGTYSDHITLPDNHRANLFNAIDSVLKSHGGAIDKHYTCVLALAQKVT